MLVPFVLYENFQKRVDIIFLRVMCILMYTQYDYVLKIRRILKNQHLGFIFFSRVITESIV